MKCHQFRDRLDAYMDGEMDAVNRQAMIDHAAGCSGCRSRTGHREWLFEIMEGHADAGNPHDIADAVMERIRELPPLMPPNPLGKSFLIAGIAALLISGVLILIGYRVVLATISPVDLIHLITGSIHLPEGLQASLSELLVFLNICWLIFRTLTQVLMRLAYIMLVTIPLTVPFLIFLATGVFLIVWRFRRQRKGSVTA